MSEPDELAASLQAGPRRRVATGLANEDLERPVLPALLQAGYEVLERCLTAEQLVAAARRREVDALVVAGDLYRLNADTAAELLASGKPAVVVGDATLFRKRAPEGDGWLGADSRPEAVLAGLAAALNGRAIGVLQPAVDQPEPEAGVPGQGEVLSSVITVASGAGSPGRTTVAVNLAAGLASCAPTILVDADLDGPSVPTYVAVRPDNNLYMVAHGRPDSSRDWAQALQRELQPFGGRSPHGAVLCGIPKPEMTGRLTLPLFERLLVELQQRYRYVVVDVGAGLAPADVIHRAAIKLAGQVLVVVSPDIPGMWQLRRAWPVFRDDLRVEPERLAVVLNRYARWSDYSRREIEWGMKMPLAAVIPADARRARKAVVDHQPMIWQSRRGAAGALLDLSERLYGGQLRLPPMPDKKPLRQRLRSQLRLPRLRKRAEPLVMPDGSSVPAAG